MSQEKKVIAVDEGVKRVMNNRTLYNRLLGNFKGREMTEEIISAIKEKDWERAKIGAHTLKGVASNLAIHLMSDTVDELEAKIIIVKEKGGETNGEISSYIPILEECLTTVENAIQEILAE